VIVEVDPEDADRLGAFAEGALDEEAAWDADVDCRVSESIVE
jgi:hypothetical protein